MFNLEPLFKALDPKFLDSLQYFREAAKAGTISSEHLQNITKQIFGDTLCPDVGNRNAYEEFLSRPKNGIHLRLDGNNLKAINDQYGHPTGDEAIKTLFGIARKAMDTSVGKANGKLFRIGGDEGHAFVPDYPSALKFVRALRAGYEEHPPINGTHNVSASVGIGHTPEHADKALYEAKNAKNAKGYVPGTAPTHVFSGIEGNQGHIL